MYLSEPDENLPRREAPASMLVPTAVMIGLTIYFGVYTPHSAGIAEGAAKLLLGVAP